MKNIYGYREIQNCIKYAIVNNVNNSAKLSWPRKMALIFIIFISLLILGVMIIDGKINGDTVKGGLVIVGVSIALVSIPLMTTKSNDIRNFTLNGDPNAAKMSIAKQKQLGKRCIIS